jgi:hypothetical protein
VKLFLVTLLLITVIAPIHDKVSKTWGGRVGFRSATTTTTTTKRPEDDWVGFFFPQEK